jgi:hypothetical protein
MLTNFTICVSCKKDRLDFLLNQLDCGDQREEMIMEASEFHNKKYPENAWICQYCREFNYNEEGAKMGRAYCQHC